MANRVTITLTDEAFQRAQRLAIITGRQVKEIVAETLEVSLPDIPITEPPISELSDANVLAASRLEMDAKDDKRLSLLLDHQREGSLTDAERNELVKLMQLYKVGLLRKSQALREAVERGLIAPIKS